MSVPAKPIRAAIYTRKSHEEGLEQAFNSLDAQREAGEAYVRSQAGLGWTLIPKAYDDGGYSGGTLERPALKALLEDIAKGEVDIVVVYKLDRLSRSISDFGRIVEVLDKAGAEFVAVTQPVNTTTSMGRLMVHVLLSFAQFEREVTGERIRDKIAASKAKGMWMGGSPPLGYDAPGDNRLEVNEAEAETVRKIFARYLKLGSVHKLVEELDRKGIKSKAWVSTRGRAMGGKPIGRGALFHMLRNRLYIGEIVHKGQAYPGRHSSIIDRETFEKVQAKLAGNRVRKRRSADRPASALLTGKIYGGDGKLMSPTFSTGRRGTIHRYYTASSLQAGKASRPCPARSPADPGDWPRRIPAGQLEAAVLGWLKRLSGNAGLEWEQGLPMLQRIDVRAERTELLLNRDPLFGLDHPELAFEDLQGRLLEGERAVWAAGDVRVALPLTVRFRGGRTWISASGDASWRRSQPNAALIGALKKAHELLYQLGAPAWADRQSWAQARPHKSPYDRQLISLALLAPDLQQCVLSGRHLRDLSIRDLLNVGFPMSWAQQRDEWPSFGGHLAHRRSSPPVDSIDALAAD